jgi:hypothetical protein
MAFRECAPRSRFQILLESTRDGFGLEFQRNDYTSGTVVRGVDVLTGVMPRQATVNVRAEPV